jgi:hypothetical protein
MDKQTYEVWSRVVAFSLKLVGVLGIIFVPVFWAFTGRIELAFLPFFGTLAGVGQGLDVLKEISEGKVKDVYRVSNGGDESRQKGSRLEERPTNDS